jgi:hypothetical protein
LLVSTKLTGWPFLGDGRVSAPGPVLNVDEALHREIPAFVGIKFKRRRLFRTAPVDIGHWGSRSDLRMVAMTDHP